MRKQKLAKLARPSYERLDQKVDSAFLDASRHLYMRVCPVPDQPKSPLAWAQGPAPRWAPHLEDTSKNNQKWDRIERERKKREIRWERREKENKEEKKRNNWKIDQVHKDAVRAQWGPRTPDWAQGPAGAWSGLAHEFFRD